MSALSDLLPIKPGGGDAIPTINTISETQTAREGQTVFDLKSISFRTGYDDLKVDINGVAQESGGESYTENLPTRITTASGLRNGDKIVFHIIRAVGSKESVRHYSESQTASDGQTVFNLKTIYYRIGYQDLTVDINGVTQDRSPTVYSEISKGDSVTLLTPVNAGDRLCFSILRMG